MLESPSASIVSPEPLRHEQSLTHAAKEQRIADVIRYRRRIRWARFIAAETVALAVLVLSVVAGISERFVAENFTPIFRALPITAAAVAAILPILFFGDPKRRARFKSRQG